MIITALYPTAGRGSLHPHTIPPSLLSSFLSLAHMGGCWSPSDLFQMVYLTEPLSEPPSFSSSHFTFSLPLSLLSPTFSSVSLSHTSTHTPSLLSPHSLKEILPWHSRLPRSNPIKQKVYSVDTEPPSPSMSGLRAVCVTDCVCVYTCIRMCLCMLLCF